MEIMIKQYDVVVSYKTERNGLSAEEFLDATIGTMYGLGYHPKSIKHALVKKLEECEIKSGDALD